jgi:hypothetical protein
MRQRGQERCSPKAVVAMSLGSGLGSEPRTCCNNSLGRQQKLLREAGIQTKVHISELSLMGLALHYKVS